jgi:hypothetical protein
VKQSFPHRRAVAPFMMGRRYQVETTDRTVGEVREASDDMLLSLPDLGHGSVTHLRETLGLPSRDGVRPLGKKPA